MHLYARIVPAVEGEGTALRETPHPTPIAPNGQAGAAGPRSTGGEEGDALREPPHPARGAPNGQAGAANMEACLMVQYNAQTSLLLHARCEPAPEM